MREVVILYLLLFIVCVISKERSGRRILNGIPSEYKYHPYVISIRMKTFTDFNDLCTGSLIHPYWVLTAAHCFYHKNSMFFPYQVTLEHGSSKNDSLIQYKVKYLIPNYLFIPNERVKVKHDIGLIKSKLPIKSPTVSLPNYCHQYELKIGTPVKIIGWGFDNTNKKSGHMQEARTSIGRCISEYDRDGFKLCSKTTKIFLPRTAAGDSGGPVLYFNKTTFVQIGVVHGLRLTVDEKPMYMLFFDVSMYLPWIELIMTTFS